MSKQFELGADVIHHGEVTVAIDQDALNYPYIRIRDVNWLKRTLLVFPHVARIAPSYGAPPDSLEVAEFLRLEGRRGPLLRNVDLDGSNIWKDQHELQLRIEEALSANREAFIARYGRLSTLGDSSLIRESATLWSDRLASRTFQLHRQKVVSALLDFLFRHDLAWEPTHSHGNGYVEMHPRLGEAVLATLAFACARNEGLHLVTEFPQLYGRTIHRDQQDIFQSCLGLPHGSRPLERPAHNPISLAEFVVYQHCDVSKLTPQNLQSLNMEWEAIGAFRDKLEHLAAEIPSQIESGAVIHQRLTQKARDILVGWQQDHKNLSRTVKDLMAGDTDEIAKVLEKVVEKGLGEPAVGGAGASVIASGFFGGSITYHALVGAAAGLAIALVVRTVSNEFVAKSRSRENPLRYLTMMEKAGVSYMVSN